LLLLKGCKAKLHRRQEAPKRCSSPVSLVRSCNTAPALGPQFLLILQIPQPRTLAALDWRSLDRVDPICPRHATPPASIAKPLAPVAMAASCCWPVCAQAPARHHCHHVHQIPTMERGGIQAFEAARDACARSWPTLAAGAQQRRRVTARRFLRRLHGRVSAARLPSIHSHSHSRSQPTTLMRSRGGWVPNAASSCFAYAHGCTLRVQRSPILHHAFPYLRANRKVKKIR
jgi:hypothetical protein